MKKYNSIIIIFFFVITLLPLVSNNARAESVYLKLEIPVVTKIGGIKQNKNQNTYSNNIRKTHDESKINISNQFGIGLGYKLSDYFDAELMYSQLQYSFLEVDANINNDCSTTKRDADQLYGYATPASSNRRAYCASNPNTFVNQQEICGSPNVCSDTVSSHISSKIDTLVGSVKFKPFGQVKMFTPYVSVGAGAAVNKVKKINYSMRADGIANGPSAETKRSIALAYELGIGTRVHLMEKVNLEFTAKYFDYGKHMFKKDVSRKINGYKFSIGAIFVLW